MLQPHILGHSVTVTFDDSFSCSRISRQLAAGLKVSDDHITLPINANMGSGPLILVVELKVDSGLSSDVVLGRDWFADYREYMISEKLLTFTQSACEVWERDTGGLNPILFLVCCFIFFRCCH